jgi:hypothetical protein
MSKHGRASLSAVGLLVVGTFGACGDSASPDNALEEVTSELATPGKPQGLTCGIGYYRNCVNVDMGICDGVETGYTTGNCNSGNWSFTLGNATGLHNAADGDRSCYAPWGFYHQAWTNSDPNVNANSAWLLLPKGTACGFKDNCNNYTELCMGLDPANSCPSGWNMMFSGDAGAPAKCNHNGPGGSPGPGAFVWCEYQDPNHVCNGTCQTTDQLYGTVCGISDNDKTNYGECLGVFPGATGTCPAGYQWHGRFDDGRSVGHGLSWCSRD